MSSLEMQFAEFDLQFHLLASIEEATEQFTILSEDTYEGDNEVAMVTIFNQTSQYFNMEVSSTEMAFERTKELASKAKASVVRLWEKFVAFIKGLFTKSSKDLGDMKEKGKVVEKEIKEKKKVENKEKKPVVKEGMFVRNYVDSKAEKDKDLLVVISKEIIDSMVNYKAGSTIDKLTSLSGATQKGDTIVNIKNSIIDLELSVSISGKNEGSFTIKSNLPKREKVVIPSADDSSECVSLMHTGFLMGSDVDKTMDMAIVDKITDSITKELKDVTSNVDKTLLVKRNYCRSCCKLLSVIDKIGMDIVRERLAFVVAVNK